MWPERPYLIAPPLPAPAWPPSWTRSSRATEYRAQSGRSFWSRPFSAPPPQPSWGGPPGLSSSSQRGGSHLPAPPLSGPSPPPSWHPAPPLPAPPLTQRRVTARPRPSSRSRLPGRARPAPSGTGSRQVRGGGAGEVGGGRRRGRAGSGRAISPAGRDWQHRPRDVSDELGDSGCVTGVGRWEPAPGDPGVRGGGGLGVGVCVSGIAMATPARAACTPAAALPVPGRGGVRDTPPPCSTCGSGDPPPALPVCSPGDIPMLPVEPWKPPSAPRRALGTSQCSQWSFAPAPPCPSTPLVPPVWPQDPPGARPSCCHHCEPRHPSPGHAGKFPPRSASGFPTDSWVPLSHPPTPPTLGCTVTPTS